MFYNPFRLELSLLVHRPFNLLGELDTDLKVMLLVHRAYFWFEDLVLVWRLVFFSELLVTGCTMAVTRQEGSELDSGLILVLGHFD